MAIASLIAAIVLSTSGALAQVVLKQLSAAPGERVRLGGHLHWTFSTCEMRSIPVVKVLKAPVGGRIESVVEPILVQRVADTRAAHCLGRSIRGVRLFYQSREDWSGADEIEYSLTFPPKCKSCINRKFNVIVTVARPPAPPQPQTSGPRPAPPANPVDDRVPRPPVGPTVECEQEKNRPVSDTVEC